MRADIYREQGNLEAAVTEANAVIAAGPEDTYAWVAAGRIYAINNNQQAAMNAFQHALAIKPKPISI